MTPRLFTAILAAAAIAAPAPIVGQTAYEEQVLDILSSVSGVALDQGYSAAGGKIVSSLRESQSEDQYLDLVGGLDYVVVAVCDVDCSDIDLRLYDPSGSEVASDTQTDDVPVLELSSVRGGRYRLEVGMYDCDTEPCYYAVGVYSRSASAAPSPPTSYVDQVEMLLSTFGEVAEGQGYSATGEQWISSLAASSSEDQFVTLGGGADYAIIAVCDTDCEDMDLAIYGPSGSLVDEDVATDANPVLQVDDASGGRYRVEVRMFQCSNEPCIYGMAVYKRVRQESAPLAPADARR